MKTINAAVRGNSRDSFFLQDRRCYPNMDTNAIKRAARRNERRQLNGELRQLPVSLLMDPPVAKVIELPAPKPTVHKPSMQQQTAEIIRLPFAVRRVKVLRKKDAFTRWTAEEILVAA